MSGADGPSWFDTRTPPPPPELSARLLAAAGAQPGVAELADGAFDRLAAAIEACPDRAAAFELLAADALLTYVFEAAAEAGPDAVAAAVERLAPARFAALIAPDGRR